MVNQYLINLEADLAETASIIAEQAIAKKKSG